MQRSNKINNINNGFNPSSELNDPKYVFDLAKSVRKFLQKVGTSLEDSVSNNGSSSLKDDSFYELVRISVEPHVYHKQWQTTSWTVQDLQRIVDIINRYELNALALHGKAVWLLHMILKHSRESLLPALKQNESLSKGLIQVLFEVIFTQTVYNKSISILRLLKSLYEFSFTDIFIVGAQMKDKYPEMIEDHNFIALLHFADEAVQCEPQSVHFSMELLLALSTGVFGDLEKSNYFLPRTTSLFNTGLQIESFTTTSATSVSSSSSSIEIQPGVTVNIYSTFGNTIVLLRTLATFHPLNREYFGSSSCQHIIDIVIEYLLNRSHYQNEWYESISREILVFLNVLASAGMAMNKIMLINRLPLTSLYEVAAYELIGINDALIDLYLTLYEDSLSYCDDELRYMISDDKDHQLFLQKVLESMTKKLMELMTMLPSSNATKDATSSQQQSENMIEVSYVISMLYRVLLRLEISLRIASDVTSFLSFKQDILTIFHELLGVNPRKWNLRYLKLADILVLLHCGADNCWDVPALHALDQGFVNISHQLVAQFVSLTNDKIFDAKDRNTLNYLAGSDENSTIQSIISKNCDDEYNKSFEISSPNITSTLESSGSMSRSPRQVGLLLNSSNGGSSGNLQQLFMTSGGSSSAGAPTNASVPAPATAGADDGNNLTASPKIRPNSNFASGCFKVSEQEIQQYLTSFRQLLGLLSQHINFIVHMVSDWMLEEAMLNYKRLAYLYLVLKLFGVVPVNQVIHQSQHMIELLWKNVLCNESSSNSMMFDDKFYLFDLHKRCVQVITLFLQDNGNNSGGEVAAGGDAGANAFSGAVAYGEWLTKAIEQRPRHLQKTNKQKAKDMMASRKIDDERGNGKGRKGKDNSNDNAAGTRGSGSSSNEEDDVDDDELMSRSVDDRMSLMGNIVIRPSAFASIPGSNGGSGGDNTGDSSNLYNEEDYNIASMTGGIDDERCLFQFPHHMDQWLDHDLNLDFHYTCVDSLVTLSVVDRTVRRKLVATCSSLIDSLYLLSPMDPINGKPLLHLVKSMVEFVPKLELNAEEAIVGLIIRNITSPLFNIRTQVCDLIYSIGQESPGFIFRGISRREIEDPLIQIFVHQQEHYELIRNTKQEKEREKREQQQKNKEKETEKGNSNNAVLLVNDEIKPYAILLLNALKACTVIVHNFNVKPIWLPSPWLYHWQYYQPIIATRDIMTAKGLAIIISVLKHAAIPYRLPYFMYTLSLTSSIMYAFSDGMINPTDKHDILQMKFLKDLLVENTLPWLPIAIDFIILGKRKKARGKSITGAVAAAAVAAAASSSNGTEESVKSSPSSKNGAGASAKASSPVSVNPTANVVLNCRKPVPPASTFVKIDFSNQESKSILVDGQKLHDYLTSSTAGSEQAKLNKAVAALTLANTKGNAATNATTSASELDVYENMYKIKAIEMLTERTMEAIYAFLCTDDMFPLSTYLQYIHLFQTNSLIASVSYFMTEFKENPIILRRGLDFMKYFSDYQMNLSSMAMHAPPALVNAFLFHKDVYDVQLAFVKVIFVICRTHDDFAKENVIRFNIHIHLVTLLNQLVANVSPSASVSQHNSDLIRLIIQTYLELIFNENQALLVTSSPNEVHKFVDSLVNILNVMVKDIKVQYEAVRALATLDYYCTEYVGESPKRQVIFPALKKAKKLLVQEQSKFPDSEGNDANGGGPGSNTDPAGNMVHMANPIMAGGGSGVGAMGAGVPMGSRGKEGNQAKSGLPGVSTHANGDISKQDLDMLLGSKIWAKEKCTIC